ncbi:MAG: hypothetical protein IH845_05330 [Nanoarchaeota archaeon]|nr:hypothetical protein [Nanoarchaeota archaeon]
MKETNWKSIAITSMVTLLLILILLIWGFYLERAEEEKTYSCYYDICADYPEAVLDDPLCTCYEYDVLGNLQEVKTVYLK